MISHRVQKRLTHEVHEALALRDKRGQEQAQRQTGRAQSSAG